VRGPVYAQRPSKAVTRAILIDALHRLSAIADLRTYQYVGFGALEFIDFDLVHRRLGVESMTSIEKRPGEVVRQSANVPFNGITVVEGDAKDVLPQLDWDPMSVVWLDFEDALNFKSVIPAVEYLCLKMRPGSVLAVTLRAAPHKPIDKRLEQLEDDIGPERVPDGVTDATLGGWGTAEVQRDVLNSIITAAVADRPGQRDRWTQLLNIEYNDTTQMQVVAGIIGGPGVDRAIGNCAFEEMDTFRSGPETLRIEVPYLTPKEQRLLNERLPRAKGARLRLPGVSKEDVAAYASAYRWLDSTG
jgi:hypothetical protein